MSGKTREEEAERGPAGEDKRRGALFTEYFRPLCLCGQHQVKTAARAVRHPRHRARHITLRRPVKGQRPPEAIHHARQHPVCGRLRRQHLVRPRTRSGQLSIHHGP